MPLPLPFLRTLLQKLGTFTLQKAEDMKTEVETDHHQVGLASAKNADDSSFVDGLLKPNSNPAFPEDVGTNAPGSTAITLGSVLWRASTCHRNIEENQSFQHDTN